MSGTETLIPYLKETGKVEQPTIIVDSREANTAPKIIKGLKEHGADIRIEALDKGDYIVSDLCAFERKTVHDFVYTLTRRYLFEQLFRLKEVAHHLQIQQNPTILSLGSHVRPRQTRNLHGSNKQLQGNNRLPLHSRETGANHREKSSRRASSKEN